MLTAVTGTNALAGRTVLRFAHAFESGGGTERYLDDLDRTLLQRNEMSIIRLHVTRSATGNTPVEDKVGKGTLLRMPLPIVPTADHGWRISESDLGIRLKQMARDKLLYHPVVWHTFGARWTASLTMRHEPGQAIGAGAAAAEVMRTRRVDLVMLHFFGGADADEIVDAAREARVPFAILNHYSNDRFLHLTVRKHAMLATGVAGVNGLDVPDYLRGRVINLSDGIDTEFFRRDHARPLVNPPSHPVILLPARVIREKGQLDLLRAVSSLRRSGMECGLAFAGRVDASGFVDDLRREIAQTGMTDYVRFLGNLSVEELRDWYAASAVVAFPTYHHEGLGRVIIEAQAMETPVVAYATGGVPEAIIPGKTGYLLPTGDIDGLTTRLHELLSSPALRASIGAAGRAAVETRFSLAALAERHERFYAAVITDFKVDGANASVG